jgi:hypothetical protein
MTDFRRSGLELDSIDSNFYPIDAVDENNQIKYITIDELQSKFTFEGNPIILSGSNNFNIKFDNISLRIKKKPVYTTVARPFRGTVFEEQSDEFYEEINNDERILHKASDYNIAPKLHFFGSIILDDELITFLRLMCLQQGDSYNVRQAKKDLLKFYSDLANYNSLIRIQISESYDSDLLEFYQNKKLTSSFKRRKAMVSNLLTLSTRNSSSTSHIDFIDHEDEEIATQLVELFRKSIYDMKILCYDIKPLNTVIRNRNGKIKVKLIDWDSDWCKDKYNDHDDEHVKEIFFARFGGLDVIKNTFLFINCVIMANHFYYYLNHNILYKKIMDFRNPIYNIDLDYVKELYCKENMRRDNFFTMSSHYFKGRDYDHMRKLIEDIDTESNMNPNAIERAKRSKCMKIFDILLENSTKVSRDTTSITIPSLGRGKRNPKPLSDLTIGGKKKRKSNKTKKSKKIKKKSRKNRKTKK